MYPIRLEVTEGTFKFNVTLRAAKNAKSLQVWINKTNIDDLPEPKDDEIGYESIDSEDSPLMKSRRRNYA